jgi:hypothetical protein
MQRDRTECSDAADADNLNCHVAVLEPIKEHTILRSQRFTVASERMFYLTAIDGSLAASFVVEQRRTVLD